MALNYIWAAFFLVSFVVALVRLIFFGDTQVFPDMLKSTFDSAALAVTVAIGMIGTMSLWLGLMNIGERGGVIRIISRLIGPFFARLFPEVPREHPAAGAMMMNFSATIVGLDNAATPFGLKAMEELQKLNPDKETASNAQIMFIVLNTSGLVIIPLAILVDRAALHSADPTAVFIPCLLATFCSTLTAFIYVSLRQRIRWDWVVLSYVLGLSSVVGSFAYYLSSLPKEELEHTSQQTTGIIILSIMTVFLILGLRKKINLFETFIEGAKEGFQTAVKIIPFMVGFIVGAGLLKESGVLMYITDALKVVVAYFGANTDFVDALPVALMRPLSGGGAKALSLQIAAEAGVDSLVGNLTFIFRGCMETTFYVIALYYGSVNIRKIRYTVSASLIADLVGVIAAIFIGYMFFH